VVEAVTNEANINVGDKSIILVAHESTVTMADEAIVEDITIAQESLMVEDVADETNINIGDKSTVTIAHEALVVVQLGSIIRSKYYILCHSF